MLNEPQRPCPSCSRDVPVSAKSCPFCGADLVRAVLPPLQRFPFTEDSKASPGGRSASVPEEASGASAPPVLPFENVPESPAPPARPSAMPSVTMDGVLAEVTSSMARWLDREPETREQRAAQVVELLERDALLARRRAGKEAPRRAPALLWISLLPWALAALLAAAGWQLWQGHARDVTRLTGAHTQSTLAQSTIEMQGQAIQGAQATVAAQETSMAYDARRIMGPMSGALVHDRDGFLESFPLTVSLRDFDLRVRFVNPYDGTVHPWDFGIMFRNIGGSGSYRLMILSTGAWKLTYGALPGVLASGELDNLDLGAGMSNELLLQVAGDRASFSVNGVLVSELDVSAHPDAGGISVATGLWQGDEQSGETTRFEDLRIWQGP